MKLEYTHYKPKFIMRTIDKGTLRSIDLWKFRSTKTRKWYIVEVEHFKAHFYGLKFYWKGVAQSPDRYSLLTNDYEPRIIVMSCIAVMMHYFMADAKSSFGFVGAHDLVETVVGDSPNKRFRFYRRMMLTLFSKDKFIQVKDVKNSMYLMINRSMYDAGQVSIPQIELEISRMYVGDYSFVLEP